MARNFDSVDLAWTWDGDFLVDQQGDLKDTSDNLLTSFQNEVFTRVKSDLRDWREDPNIGSDLGDFIGEPNIPSTAKELERRVASSLLDIATTSDFNVRVIPVGVHRVLITIDFDVLSTVGNKLKSGDPLVVSFIYDYFERGIFVPLQELGKFSDRNI